MRTSIWPTFGMTSRGRRHMARLIAACGCFFTLGSPVPATIAIPNEVAVANTSTHEVPAEYEPPLDVAELTRVDAEMRAYFETRVRRRDPAQDRIDQILHALFAERPVFVYEGDGTYHPTETFRRRQGNCMSFALLFVAIAREYGLRAMFNEVRIEPQWDRKGDFVTQSHHINVIVFDGTDRIEVDIRPWWRRDQSSGLATVISDAQAYASFYANLGVDRLTRDDDAAAIRLLRQAARIDPRSSIVWTNLATALMHTGDLAGTEQALKQALGRRPVDLVAYSTMARLCLATNRPEEAAQYERRAKRHREQNPYHHFALARAAVTRGEFIEADRHLRRALDLKEDEVRFIELRIEIARILGREAEVRRWNKALETLQATQADQLSSI